MAKMADEIRALADDLRELDSLREEVAALRTEASELRHERALFHAIGGGHVTLGRPVSAWRGRSWSPTRRRP